MIPRGCFQVLIASVWLVQVTPQGTPRVGADLSYSAMQVVRGASTALNPTKNLPNVPSNPLPQSNPGSYPSPAQAAQILTSAAPPALSSTLNIAQVGNLASMLNRNPANIQAAATATLNSAQNNGLAGSLASLLGRNPLQAPANLPAAFGQALNSAQNMNLIGNLASLFNRSPVQAPANIQAAVSSTLNTAQNNGLPGSLASLLSRNPLQNTANTQSALSPALNSAVNNGLVGSLTSLLNRNSLQSPSNIQASATSTLNSAQNNGLATALASLLNRNPNQNPANVQTAPASSSAQVGTIALRQTPQTNQAPLQVIQGPTPAIASILNFAQHIPRVVTQALPLAESLPLNPFSQANQNLQSMMVRGGVNALSEGVKTGAAISSMPARVVTSGLDEIRNVVDARLGTGNASQSADPRTRIVSSLLNTVSSQLSQANLGGEMVEQALKNRARDMVNSVAEVIPRANVTVPAGNATGNRTAGAQEAPPAITNRVMDTLLNQFNSAVRRNDERLMQALRAVIARVDPSRG